jgi:hypothetical protein
MLTYAAFHAVASATMQEGAGTHSGPVFIACIYYYTHKLLCLRVLLRLLTGSSRIAGVPLACGYISKKHALLASDVLYFLVFQEYPSHADISQGHALLAADMLYFLVFQEYPSHPDIIQEQRLQGAGSEVSCCCCCLFLPI